MLSHIGIKIRYNQLLRLLNTGEDGTPFANLERLRQRNILVHVHHEYSEPLGLLENYLAQSIPVIASVGTAYLPYWNVPTDHAVVIAGIDTSSVFLYDPWFQTAPKTIERVQTESAWLESTFLYGVIQRAN